MDEEKKEKEIDQMQHERENLLLELVALKVVPPLRSIYLDPRGQPLIGTGRTRQQEGTLKEHLVVVFFFIARAAERSSSDRVAVQQTIFIK